MAQAALADPKHLAPGVDLQTGMDTKEEALAQVAAAAESIATAKARLRSNKLLKRGILAWQHGNAAKAAKHALAATEADESNAQAFHLLAITLEKLGYTHKALVTYEHAFRLCPDDTDMLLNLGLTSWHLGNLEGAERMFRHFIEKRPDHPAGYNNLGSVQRDRGDLNTAVDTLRGAIYRMPEEAMLWNTLATTLAEDGRAEESLVFYSEALRLNPHYARVWHNLGYSYMHLGRLDEALQAYDKALTLSTHATEQIEAQHSRSICLMGMGHLSEGFAEYEIRNAQEFRASVIHFTKAPAWKGGTLAGKRVLMIGEQGLGDELMFANVLPDVARAVGPDGKLQIAVDPRLIALFARSFPQAQVGPYEDRKLEAKFIRIFEWARAEGEPDTYGTFGTPLQYFRKSLADFPREAFLTADPERAGQFRARLQALGPEPVVGLCWRSMVLGPRRQKYYSPLDAWLPILKTPGIRFVNLQYGDCAAELAQFKETYGIEILNFADLDLRNDIDGAAALSEACDLVISAPTAAAALAGAIGKEVWFMVAGRVWPQLGSDNYPWYAASRVFTSDKFADWNAVMPRVAGELAEFARVSARRG